MIKTKSKCGYTVYKVTAVEVMRLGGIGVCDECNCAALHGYLVPVLNHYMCQDCYNEWNEQATYYEEDIPYEQRMSEYYEKMIPIERSVTILR